MNTNTNTFPAEFSLAGFPGKTFRVNPERAYTNDAGALVFVVEVCAAGEWHDHSKGTFPEINAQIVNSAPTEDEIEAEYMAWLDDQIAATNAPLTEDEIAAAQSAIAEGAAIGAALCADEPAAEECDKSERCELCARYGVTTGAETEREMQTEGRDDSAVYPVCSQCAEQIDLESGPQPLFYTITYLYGGSCGHKHRSIKAAARCAKKAPSKPYLMRGNKPACVKDQDQFDSERSA